MRWKPVHSSRRPRLGFLPISQLDDLITAATRRYRLHIVSGAMPDSRRPHAKLFMVIGDPETGKVPPPQVEYQLTGSRRWRQQVHYSSALECMASLTANNVLEVGPAGHLSKALCYL